MRTIKILLVILLFTSCVNFSDVNKNLGSGYYLLREGKSISYIYLAFDEKNPAIDSIIVYPSIYECEYCENFIIAKQFPNREEIKHNLMFFNNKSATQCDSILNDTFKDILLYDSCYWIIKKIEKKTFGPLSVNEFYIKKDSLGVAVNF